MKDDLTFMRKLFRKNNKQFKKLLDDAENIRDFDIIWSDSFVDFYPYESLLEGYQPPSIYKAQPKDNNNLVMSKSISNNIYYACKYLHKDWGSMFYLHDVEDSMIRLFYENQNTEDKMLLSQVTYKITKNNLVQKVLFYMLDEDMEEETLYIYEFAYEDSLVKKIARYDFFYPEDNTILYQLEYKNNRVHRISNKKI